MSIKSKFFGTESMKVSVAGENVIENIEGWSYNPPRLTSFSFMNEESCTVSVNGSDPIYLKEYQGFFFESKHGGYVDSFVVLEDGINYQTIGGVQL